MVLGSIGIESCRVITTLIKLSRTVVCIFIVFSVNISSSRERVKIIVFRFSLMIRPVLLLSLERG